MSGSDAHGVLRRTPRTLPVDAVLFDLDGTLADTAPDLGAALNRVRRDHGLDPVALDVLRCSSSHGARGLLRVGMGVVPEHPDYSALRDALLAHYEAALCVDTKLFADVDMLLDAIEARSLKWGIVTNKAARYTTPLIARLGLDKRAVAVVCGDTTPFVKPHLLYGARSGGALRRGTTGRCPTPRSPSSWCPEGSEAPASSKDCCTRSGRRPRTGRAAPASRTY